MKKMLLLLAVIVVLVAVSQPSVVYGQAVNVTFRINTATVPDTLVPTDTTIQLRGSMVPFTWDNLTGGKLTNTPGGDYWSGTFQFHHGDTVHYKINTKGAWEQNVMNADGLPGDGNRSLIVTSTSDTTIDLPQFFNNGAVDRPQFFRPWSPAADSFFNVYFRVNMSGIDSTTSPFNFHKDRDTVAVRGGFYPKNPGSDLAWDTNLWLTREEQATNGGFSYDATNFWSGRARISKNLVHPGDKIEYKYLIGYTWGRDELQGGAPNRFFFVPQGYKDTTLYFSYYNNMKPIARANPDTVVVTYLVNMATAIQQRGFAIGDTVQVTTGYFSTATTTSTKMLSRVGISTRYTATDTVVTAVGKTLDYQYYLVKSGNSYRENYYNFYYTGSISAEHERRQVTVTSKDLSVLDTVTSVSDSRRQPVFRNQTLVARDLTVAFEVDLRPAIYTVKAGKTLVAIQGGLSVSNADSILKWGVAINGPATDTTNSWAAWGSSLIADTTRVMYDDGTHGDRVASDSIFTRILTYRAGKDIVGQEFKYGIGGSDNEGGFGNNHIENLDDSQPTSILFTQFGSIDPNFYNAWDFNCDCPATPAAVDETKGKPVVYKLDQNYPNPFNPSTKIEYDLPKESFVTLKVYNLLGQEIATIVNEKQTAGSHRVSFDASKVPSGIYFYTITAGDFTNTKKMVLMK